MTKQEKYLDSLTGAVILNQLALNFNEDLKYTKFYKHELKKSLNMTIKHLIKAETKEFDKVFDAESERNRQYKSKRTNNNRNNKQRYIYRYGCNWQYINSTPKRPKGNRGNS